VRPAEDAVRARKRARKLWWSVAIGRPVFTALASTWRIEETHTEAWRRLKAEGKPFLLAVWHGQMVPVIWANRFRDLGALASTHGDAEIAARMMMRWGYSFVRGSSSQGGREALGQVVEHLKEGRSFAFTPDGPRGPRGVPKPGVMVASMRSGVPIIGVRIAISRAWRLGSWDRTAIPKPFARLRVTYSDPWVAPDVSEASVARLQELLGPAEAGTLGRER
jgi:lysophospholipid acyltransferase (LPLAT)-like uncharacterized protein